MKRRRSFGSRRRKKPMQWVASLPGYGQSQSIVIPGAALIPIELAGATSVAGTGFDPPLIQRYTVERIMGDLCVNMISNAQDNFLAVLHLGVIVCDVGVVTSVTGLPDPGNQLFAGNSWLWLKHICLPVPQITNSSGLPSPSDQPVTDMSRTSTWRPSVDIKVKRVLRENQVLLLMASLGFAAGGGSAINMLLLPYLRSLISRVA